MYMLESCTARIRTTENFEVKCNIRYNRATMSTGNVLRRKTTEEKQRRAQARKGEQKIFEDTRTVQKLPLSAEGRSRRRVLTCVAVMWGCVGV